MTFFRSIGRRRSISCSSCSCKGSSSSRRILESSHSAAGRVGVASAVSSISVSSVFSSSGMVTVKVDPWPTTDSTWISPSRSEASSWVMDKPSPAPSMPCAFFSRVKAWKTSCFSCVVIPFPVSFTATVRRNAFSSSLSLADRVAKTLTLPCVVYFTALPTRLSNIWRRRKASARQMVPFPPCSVSPSVLSCHASTICRPFSSAFSRWPSTHSRSSCEGEKLTGCTSISPFSS